MQRFGITFLVLLSASACGESGSRNVSTAMIHIPATASELEKTSEKYPEIYFEDTIITINNLVEGQTAVANFAFENIGDAPLVIADVSTSCGCTVAQNWPREPIHNGEKQIISVTFDSRQRPGENEKSIFVVTNANPSTTELKLKAWVIGPESDPTSTPSIDIKEPTS